MLPAASTTSIQQNGIVRTTDIYTVCFLFVLLMRSKSSPTPRVCVCARYRLLSLFLSINCCACLCHAVFICVCVFVCVHALSGTLVSSLLLQNRPSGVWALRRWFGLTKHFPTCAHTHTHACALLSLVAVVSVSENTDKFNGNVLVLS